MDGFIQLIPGIYKSEKPNTITGIDKMHLKCDCVNGSVVNGTGEPIFYSFGFDQSQAHKIYKEPRIRIFKKITKSVFPHYIFLEDDDHKPLDFNNEAISFTCQLI